MVRTLSTFGECDVHSSDEHQSRTSVCSDLPVIVQLLCFSEDFVLPREEARRLFRANNQVWDLRITEDKLQRVLDACARNANVGIDDALKLLAK
jgi:hypothetical protein